ncbi:MAG: flagellar basal-body rod protein FlgF [Woeseiaceae bacterium]|nr:flagellar basal-body rod protein FlgF [Woeseiaceae bacterium]
MDKMIYTAMTGAKQTETAQAINSNNLANISTTGFRADLHAFSSVPVEGPGVDSRVNAVVESYGTDMSQGPIMNTGRDLDIAIRGRGFIAVLAADGREAYTRSGNLQLEPGGLLTTGNGHLVLGDGGPLSLPPNNKIEIGRDGTVSVQPLGSGPETLTIADRIRLVNPDVRRLQKGEDGLFYLPNNEIAFSDANVKVTNGALENSNVNVAMTLVNMIELARQYEMQVNMIKASQDNADAAAQMMRLG